MRRFAFAVMLFIVPLPVLAAHQHDDDDPRDAPAIVDRGEIVEQLSNVDALIFDALGRARGRPAAMAALKRAREQLAAIRSQVAGAPNPLEWRRAQRRPSRWLEGPVAEGPRYVPPPPGGAPVPPPPPPSPQILPISDAALAQLLSAMDQQPSSGGRLRVLQQAAPANYFLVAQVQVLLGRLTFAPDQVQAARLLQPRVLDRENEYQLNSWLQAPPSNPWVERSSFEARTSVRLQPGLYRGDFRVAGSSLTVQGAGRDQTIIDGNFVIIGSFNAVTGLTVLGKVIIEGSQNQLRDVDFRAGLGDKGLMNKY